MIIKWNSLLNGGKKRKQFLIVSCFRNEGKYKRNSRFEVKSQITCSVLRSYVIFLLPLHLWWEYFIDLLFENLYRQKYLQKIEIQLISAKFIEYQFTYFSADTSYFQSKLVFFMKKRKKSTKKRSILIAGFVAKTC